jgi:fumarate reductase subunit D
MAERQRAIDEQEPLWWGLFAAGGMVAAMCTPAHILLQGLLGRLGLPVATERYGGAERLARSPLVRLYLFVLTALPLFHWAHRFRFYLLDLGVMGAQRLVARLLYGSAILGALGGLRVFLRRPAPPA